MNNKPKHVFKLVETHDVKDYPYYVYECEKCLQMVKMERDFLLYLILHQPSIPFALKALSVVPPCNPVRGIVVIDVPEIPNCGVCTRRPVFDPGSKGIGGALCQVCYYDL